MFSNLLNRLPRSFAFRLSLGYLALFTLSAVILFGLLYFLLAATLQSKDQEIIVARLRECVAVYDTGGLPALQALVERNRVAKEDKSFFIRLAGWQGTVLLLTAPEDWVHFDASALNRGGDVSRLVWLRLPKNEQSDFTVAAMRLADGSVLQVGRSTNNRSTLLQPFRRDFLLVMTPALLLGGAGRRVVCASGHQAGAGGGGNGPRDPGHGQPRGARAGECGANRAGGSGPAVQPGAGQKPGPDQGHAGGAG